MEQAAMGSTNDGGLPTRRARELRSVYNAVPAGRLRWRHEQGQTFLAMARQAKDEHGARAVAAALGITAQGVHYMLAQQQQLSADMNLPRDNVMRPLVAAHVQVLQMRTAGKQARRTTREYRDLHLALIRIMGEGWTVLQVATAAGVPVRELNRFLEVPSMDTLRLLALEDVEAAWAQYRNARSPSVVDRRGHLFLKFLEAAVDLGVTRARIAHRLQMTPQRVSNIMVNKMSALRRGYRPEG